MSGETDDDVDGAGRRRVLLEKLVNGVDALRAGLRELLLVWAVIASTVTLALVIAQHAPAARTDAINTLLNGVAGALFVWLLLGVAVEGTDYALDLDREGIEP